jgi:hypothetical protein
MASQLSKDVEAIRAGRRWSDRQLQGGEITTADVNSGSSSNAGAADVGWRLCSPQQPFITQSDPKATLT